MIPHFTTGDPYGFVIMTIRRMGPTSSLFACKNVNLHLENPTIRTIMEETWNALPQRFPGIALDEFVMMPDHIHFILWLHPGETSHPTLGDVVGSCMDQFWQRDFYDHVIRDETDLEQKRTYIRDNPSKEDLKNQR